MKWLSAGLRHPQVVIVWTAVLVIAGVVALFTMPRREDPKITVRVGLVAAIYPGATSEEVEQQVTRKIEERLFRFAEVRREKSFSTTRNGLVIINVELNESVHEPDVFWAKLRGEMQQLRAELPSGVQGPLVDSEFGDTAAALIAVSSASHDYASLSDYAKRAESELRAMPEVSKIERIGDQREQLVVSESAAALAQHGVTPAQIMQTLAGRSAISYAGRAPSGEQYAPISATGGFRGEEDVKNLLIASPLGAPTRIGDLAQVERGYADPSQYVRVSGERTILLVVEMHEGRNIVDFGHAMRARLDRLQATLPPDVHLQMVADQPRAVEGRVSGFFREFGVSIAAVILVTMLLLPMRVALVAAVAIPTTTAITFAVLNMVGVELHQVSIAALIVVLGMVVDDAIVIADNYVELLDSGVTRDEAAGRCAADMFAPVLTATLTIIASFAPLAWLSGSTGEFIRALPITVAIALATSFVVAMLLTPLTARRFIRSGLHQNARSGKTLLDRMQELYGRVMAWVLQHRQMTLTAALLAVVIGVGLLWCVKSQFFPLAERDQFVVDVWLPEGAKLSTTDAVTQRLEAALKGEAKVRNYASFLGAGAPRFYYNVDPQPPADNYAQILVNTTSADATPELVAELRRTLPSLAPEARIVLKELQQGSGMAAPIEVRITGADDAPLKELAAQAQEILRHTPGASGVHDDWHEALMQTSVHLRHASADRLGLTDADVAQQLAVQFDGAPAATLWEGDHPVDVVLRLDESQRHDFTDLANAQLLTTSGASMPLRAVADLKPEWRASRIVRRNGMRTITVRAYANGSQLPSQVLADARKKLDALQLPQGVSLAYGGEDEDQRETSGEMNLALMIGLMLIFLTMLLQFKTLIDPLIVMTAFPLALPGAALGLLLTGNPFGFTAFVGVISLGGLVVRNSIILIDAIRERMAVGVELQQAAREAGARRLRPIFLTTMAAAVGVTPMILSGSSLWAPMASVIAFGLLGSMFFTLIVIPVLYVAAHKFQLRRAAATAISACVACLLLSGAAQAQRRLTLDEVLQLARANNSSVVLAKLKVDESAAKTKQARADRWPTISNQTQALRMDDASNLKIKRGALGDFASTGPVPSDNISIPVGRQNFLLSTTTIAVPLTQQFKINAGVRAARADDAAAKASASSAAQEVELGVRKLFYGLLIAQEQRRAAELALQAVVAKREEARNAVEAGASLAAVEMEADAQSADARLTLGKLEDEAETLNAALNEALGLSIDERLELVVPAITVESSTETPNEELARLTAEGMQNNPGLIVARAELNKAQAGESAAKNEFIPDLTLVAQHVYQSGAPLLPPNSFSIGLRLDWTIFDGGKRSGVVQERSIQAAQATEHLRQLQRQLTVDLGKAMRRARRCAEQAASARKAWRARGELRRIAADQVAAKIVAPSALLQADARLAEADAQLYAAQLEQMTAVAELKNLTGGNR